MHGQAVRYGDADLLQVRDQRRNLLLALDSLNASEFRGQRLTTQLFNPGLIEEAVVECSDLGFVAVCCGVWVPGRGFDDFPELSLRIVIQFGCSSIGRTIWRNIGRGKPLAIDEL